MQLSPLARPRSLLALGLAAALYLSIALINLSLPGPNYDEVADAIPALELLRGEPPASALKTITLFGQPVPIMMLHYIGPTSIYTSLIGFAIFGVSVEALRLTQTLIGLLTLSLTWLLARAWFDARVAAISVLLVATAPVFVWWHRAGVFFSSPMLPLALGMMLSLTAWWRTRQRAPLVVACSLFGLGCTTKLLFVWWLGPIALTALAGLGAKGALARLRALSPATLIVCAVAFAFGLAPFLIHNIPDLDSFRFIAQNATRSQLYGHNNLDFFNNVRFQAGQLFRMIGGDTLEFSAPAPLPLTGLALVASLAYTGAWLWRHRTGTAPTRLPRLFLLLSVVAIVPLATFSVTAIGGRHLFTLVPFVMVLMASALADGWHAASARWVRAASGIVAIALALNGLIANLALVRFFEQTGGRGVWSDALNRTAARLEADFAGRPVIAMDWGFERSIALLTQGRTRMREMYEYTQAPSPRFADVSMVLLRDPANVYLFHAPAATAFGGHWHIFERAAQKSRLQLVQVADITERDGAANTLIYVAQPMKRSFAVPTLSDPRNATLSSGVVLLGGEVQYNSARREVSVWLHWRSQADALPDDTVLLHVVNQETGEVVLAADTQPVYGAYPFSQWQRGEVVADPHWVTLPDNLPPGTYQVRVGAYDRISGQRRAINDPRRDAAGDSLMLQTFEVR